MPTDKHTHAQLIKQWASELGFSHCGIAKADFLEAEAPQFEAWLKTNTMAKCSTWKTISICASTQDY